MIKVGDLIKFKGHICKVRYIETRPNRNDTHMIEFDTPNHREWESINNVQLSPFTNDTVIFERF